MRRISGAIDAGVVVAARRLVEQSLAVVRGEKLVVIFDKAHEDIGTIVCDAAIVAGATALSRCMEDFGPRPHVRLVAPIRDAIAEAQASVLLVDFHGGELEARSAIVGAAAEHKLRHGHMVGVSRASMIAGFSVDPYRISEKMRAIQTRVRPGGHIALRSDLGTALTVRLGECRWIEYGSIVSPGKRVNLPGGELVTSPLGVDGVYVADGTLGDGDGALLRNLQNTPITLRFENGRVVAVECAREPSLAHAITVRMRRTNQLDRVGLFNFGVNLGLSEPYGEIFTDQKVPGGHLSLGTTFPDKTGATWDCSSWIAFTTRSCDVDIDKHAILRRGHYLV
ncbi:hypothetical protein BH09MYX1_BH09MYX1_06190 [soil metagenome]